MATVLITLLFTLGCLACGGAGHSAEVLPTPIAGEVLKATAGHHACSADGCPFSFEVRLTNPMDRDAQVQACSVVGQQLQLSLNTIGGVYVKAGATEVAEGNRFLPLKKKAAAGLVGQSLSCEGLDWHGNPPI